MTGIRDRRNAPTAALLAALRRDAPEIAALHDAGGFPSVRAAARAAGIRITPRDPAVAIRRAWNLLSPIERETFLTEINQQP